MEKDAMMHYMMIDCVKCKTKNKAVDHFCRYGKITYVLIICLECTEVYGKRNLTDAEKKRCWTN